MVVVSTHKAAVSCFAIRLDIDMLQVFLVCIFGTPPDFYFNNLARVLVSPFGTI